MWFWIILGFVVIGAVIGAFSGEEGGCLTGALAGLFEGGSCIVRLLITAGVVLLAIALFRSCF